MSDWGQTQAQVASVGDQSSKDKEARRLARKSKNIRQKISDLFQDRFLFVTRRLKPSERKRLLHITRGLPHLRQLREIMDSVYALFDRRCRTQTALSKLKKLRHVGETLQVDWRHFPEGVLAESRQSPHRSSMTSCCPPRPTPWSVAIVAIARCKRACTECAIRPV